MVIDSQYEKWLEEQAVTDLLNWADVIIGQLEDTGGITLGDLNAFKKSTQRCEELWVKQTR